MQKWAGMLVETGMAFVDPSALSDTNERGFRLLEFAPFNDLVLANSLVTAKHPEDGPGIAKLDNTITRLITL